MNLLKEVACPISPLRINGHVVRITGLLMTTMLACYALTGSRTLIWVIASDFFIRAATPLPYSPFSWLAAKIAAVFKLNHHPIDKAPKIFAARVGFLFAFTAAILAFINPTASLIVALILLFFALLESVFAFCVGCIVYTYVVLPVFGKG
jgi:hypothetical protein